VQVAPKETLRPSRLASPEGTLAIAAKKVRKKHEQTVGFSFGGEVGSNLFGLAPGENPRGVRRQLQPNEGPRKGGVYFRFMSWGKNNQGAPKAQRRASNTRAFLELFSYQMTAGAGAPGGGGGVVWVGARGEQLALKF